MTRRRKGIRWRATNDRGTIDGDTDPDQLQGAYYFAPSAAELGDVFESVAEDILVRLTQ